MTRTTSMIAVALAGAIASSIPLPARAGVLYEQTPSHIACWFSATGLEGALLDTWRADQFRGSGAIKRIVWWGDGETATGPDDGFSIRILANANGEPGATLFEPTSGGIAGTPTGMLSGETGLPEFQWSFVLAQPFNITAGTTYWISIVDLDDPADLDPNDNLDWCWEESASTSLPGSLFSNFADGPWSTATPGNMAFRLDDSVSCGDGVRDPGEFCDPGVPGTGCCNATCTGVATSGTTCRPKAGECDAAETCNGADIECPEDEVLPNGYPCRPATGEPCDAAEVCTGVDATCPGDVPKSGSCEDQNACTVEETCSGSTCSGIAICSSSASKSDAGRTITVDCSSDLAKGGRCVAVAVKTGEALLRADAVSSAATGEAVTATKKRKLKNNKARLLLRLNKAEWKKLKSGGELTVQVNVTVDTTRGNRPTLPHLLRFRR